MTELPADLRSRIAHCIERAKVDLVPASADEIDMAVFALSAMPSQDAQGAALDAVEAMYRIGFDDLPIDLLNEGIRQAIKNSPRYRPVPGFVREFIRPELEARRRRLARLGG